MIYRMKKQLKHYGCRKGKLTELKQPYDTIELTVAEAKKFRFNDYFEPVAPPQKMGIEEQLRRIEIVPPDAKDAPLGLYDKKQLAKLITKEIKQARNETLDALENHRKTLDYIVIDKAPKNPTNYEVYMRKALEVDTKIANLTTLNKD